MINLSNGGFTRAKNCKRKYYYTDVLRIQRRYQNRGEALYFGQLWHKALAHGFMYQSSPGLETLLAWCEDHDLARRCHAMLQGYREARPYEIVCSLHEQELTARIRNPQTGYPSHKFSQYGILDMLALHRDNTVWLWEHKTAGSVDGAYLDRLWSDSQITGYVAALRDSGIEVAGVVYDIAVKPRLRQKKDEELDEFYARLEDWHRTTPGVYIREEVYIGPMQIEEWRQDVWDVTQELLEARRRNRWPRNTARCNDWNRTCQYADLCRNGGSEALINAEYEPRESPAHGNNTVVTTEEKLPF
jgi:hypothetical protein